jgi:hypothetical protein
MTTLENIKASPVYKQIIADSFGGVMYNVANRGKYDSAEIVALWSGLTPGERGAAGGIMKGAFNFLEENEV